MNQYGRIAQRHWQRWLPSRYAALESPDDFFEALGDHISEEVATLSDAIAGEDPPGEGYLQKVGRLQMARLNAESDVLREFALLPPEPGVDPDEDEAMADELRIEA